MMNLVKKEVKCEIFKEEEKKRCLLMSRERFKNDSQQKDTKRNLREYVATVALSSF